MSFFIIAGAIILYLVFDIYQRFYKPGQSTTHWPDLAERTGLIFEPAQGSWATRTSARVMGNYRGYEVKLDAPRTLSGPIDDGIATYRTRIVLTMNHRVNGSFSLKHRSLLVRWLGKNEVSQIEDEEFERRFIIESQPKDFARKVFSDPDLRRRLLAEATLRTFSLSNLGIRFETAGIESDAKRLHQQFNLVADVVQHVKRIERQ